MPVDVQIHTLKTNAQKILDGIHGNMSSGKKKDLALELGHRLVAGGISGVLAGAGISKVLKVQNPVGLSAAMGVVIGLGEAGWHVLAKSREEETRRNSIRNALSGVVANPTNSNAIHALHVSSQDSTNLFLRKLDPVISRASALAREKAIPNMIRTHYGLKDLNHTET